MQSVQYRYVSQLKYVYTIDVYRHMTIIWCTCRSNSYRGVHCNSIIIIDCMSPHPACGYCLHTQCMYMYSTCKDPFHAACTCMRMHALILDNHCENHAPCPLSMLTTYLCTCIRDSLWGYHKIGCKPRVQEFG